MNLFPLLPIVQANDLDVNNIISTPYIKSPNRLTAHSEKSPNALLWSARPIWCEHCLSVWHPLVSISLFLPSHTGFCSVLQTCIACSQFRLLCERWPQDFCMADFSLIMSQIKSHLLREASLTVPGAGGLPHLSLLFHVVTFYSIPGNEICIVWDYFKETLCLHSITRNFVYLV